MKHRFVTVRRVHNFIGVVLTVVALAAGSQAQTQTGQQTVIKIKNFGQMDERFYRGGQPDKEDYKDLAALGIKTVINLRDDPPSDEQQIVESLGMKYVSLPMKGKAYPSDATAQSFLKVTGDPATGKFFVHCAGGRHRTGAMGAVYRYKFYNWTFDQAYTEMKQYDFYTSWGHGAFKDFVKDYYDHMQATKTAVAAPPATGDKVQQK